MNINRDYLIINDVKKSNVQLSNNNIFFYITDKNTQNIFVNLVINVSDSNLITKYANIENTEDYTLTMNIVKPDNTFKIIEAKLHSKEEAIFEFNLPEDCVNKIGSYKCELLTKCNIDDHEEITTSNKLTYKVKSSVLNDLDDIVEAPKYPLVIQLFDKLSDIEQYEEDRRANELARQLAEEQRQAKHDELVSDVTDRITAMDDKMVDVENRVSTKEQAVDKLINDTKADIDEYKVAKDQEIDDYKTAKDTEINNLITAQDNKINTAITTQNNIITQAIANQNTKIDTAITAQNDKIEAVQNNDAVQNNKLDTLQNKATIHEERITATEAKNTEQDNRLDIAENRLANIGNDITNTMQPIIDAHTSRLDAIEAIDVAQNNRLGVIEAKNQQQDDRLLDIEKVNNKQAVDIKCLYGASQTIDVAKEGNSIYLQNSNNGFAVIDEIKGNTLVNYNKEPDKELILNGNINTSADNTVTLTEGVDGGLVDVALEGNTLVNVSKTKDSTALPLEEELTYLYASTQYTVQFISDTAITADITLGGTSLLAQSIVAGLNRISITTPETLVDNKLVISGVGANISEVVVTDTNREFKYFEGMKSVGELEDNKIEILSKNKNLNSQLLNDKSEFINYPCTHNGVTFNKNSDNSITITGRIEGPEKVKQEIAKWGLWGTEPNEVTRKLCKKTLTLSNDKNIPNGIILYISYYDGKKWTQRNVDNTTGYIVFEYNENDVVPFVVIGIDVRSDYNGEPFTLKPQLEYGNTKTSYVPFKLNKKEILINEPLRGLPNGVKDRFVKQGGKWYIERNYNKKILNGIETNLDQVIINSTDTHIQFNVPGFEDRLPTNNIICDALRVDANASEPGINVEGIAYQHSNIIVVKISKAKLSSPDVEGFVAYLQQNPITVIYQLATPVYEPIDYNPLEVYSEATHITTNSVIPTNITVKNHGFNCLLKPSTTYTVSSNLGLNTVTTPSTLTEDCLRFMDTDTSDITTMKDVLVLEGDWTSKADLIPSNFSGIESAFEQEYDAEKGKYKVNVKVANEDKTKENNITFYINEPLRGIGDVKDKVFIQNDKVIVQRNCGIRPYEDGDFGTYLTDKVNTVYPLAEPIYEEIEYNDTKLFIESFKNSTLCYNSNVPVTSTVHYSYSVPIVDTVARTASISDEQDSMIIDLATQCAVMEMYLM